MIDEENRVLRRFIARGTSEKGVAEREGPAGVAPKIRVKDVLALNEALAEGQILEDLVSPEELTALYQQSRINAIEEFGDLRVAPGTDHDQKLIVFNFRMACKVCRRKTDKRECARTLLEMIARLPRWLKVKFADVCHALDLFEPKELGRTGYEACTKLGRQMDMVDAGDGYADTTTVYEQIFRLYDYAVSCTAHIKDVSDEERKTLRASALSQSGRALVEMGDVRSGQKKLEEALGVVCEEWAERSHTAMQLRTEILTCLVGAMSKTGNQEAILAYEEEAIDVLRQLLAREDYDDLAVVRVLRQISELYIAAGRCDEAKATLDRALEVLRRSEKVGYVPLWCWTDLLIQVKAVLRAGGWEREAKDLANTALQERGVGVAARLGHEDALDVWRIANTFWMGNRIGEYAGAKNLPVSLLSAELRLLLILNADRELVRRIAREWQSIADSGDWDVLCDAARTFSGVGPEKPSWEHLAQFYHCVLLLQVVADHIAASDYCSLRNGFLSFPDFTVGDVGVLRAVLLRGAPQKRHEVGAAPLGAEQPWEETFQLEISERPPLPQDMRVELCVCSPPMRASDDDIIYDWQSTARVRDELIWAAFDQLVAAARTEVTKLRKCQMPRGLERHRDYLLGESKDDAPKCGTFYITIKDAHTCGRPACKKSYTALQHLEYTDDQLWERAKQLAEREFHKADVRGEFPKLWQQAKEDDPKQTLLHFRELL